MIQNSEWFPVRCCCQPMKVFGFIRLRNAPARVHIVLDQDGGKHEIRIERISQARQLVEIWEEPIIDS